MAKKPRPTTYKVSHAWRDPDDERNLVVWVELDDHAICIQLSDAAIENRRFAYGLKHYEVEDVDDDPEDEVPHRRAEPVVRVVENTPATDSEVLELIILEHVDRLEASVRENDPASDWRLRSYGRPPTDRDEKHIKREKKWEHKTKRDLPARRPERLDRPRVVVKKKER